MSQIDESLHPFISEYVERTMDPDVRLVFEQVLSTNASLREYVNQVSEGRFWLKKYALTIRHNFKKTALAS